MFSDTVSSGNSCGSWYTVAIPSAMASPVEWIVTGRPSNAIVPVSAASTPEMILIRVDLPAPFSPTRACTRPARIVMSALRMARTAPNRLAMPVSCRRGADSDAPSEGGAVVEDAGAGAAEGWSTVIVVAPSPSTAPAGWPPAGTRPSGSVVVLVHVVLGDRQRRAQEQRLAPGVVGDRGQVRAHVVRGLERLVLGELGPGPRGEVPQVLDVPQNRRRRRAVLQVG